MKYNELFFDDIGIVSFSPRAKYVAQDENGDWHAFTSRPIEAEGDWGEGLWDINPGDTSYMPVSYIEKGMKPGNWKKEVWEIRWL